MGDSLRDQLLKSGLVKPVQQADKRPPQPRGKPPRTAPARPNDRSGKSGGQHPRDQVEMDLARAYAIRAQAEAAERKRIEQEAAEQARIRRERKAQVQKLLEGQGLNKADADQARHFEYGGKIRRIYVDRAQLAALNAGELGVIQQAGRYVLVTRELAEQVQAIDAGVVALLVSAGEAGDSDDGVPADLIW
ncbi:MAG TPA: DUF2058 family protein [Dyella sp.]|nr:DUF2058 family protein [Dyella sp.]